VPHDRRAAGSRQRHRRRLADDITAGQINYGHLQVTFDDGSVGWYEAGWGPMMSETAFFVKDVIGPKGSVSIVAQRATRSGRSADIESHTSVEALRIHHAALGRRRLIRARR
jgi:hypothetical protein